jgi:hypothetical protein
MMRTGRVKRGITPPCITFKTRAAKAFVASTSPLRDKRGKRTIQARLNTAWCDCNEWRLWWTVILWSLRFGPVFLFLSVDSGSSKYLRQSSSSPSGISGSPSSSSSTAEPLEDLNGTGFFPSWGIHHSLISERSLGNLFERSRMLRKFSATWGRDSAWQLETKVLKGCQNDIKEVKGGITYAASRRKNHLISS